MAQAFHEHYYNTFDQNRQALAGLYQENAILSFEGNQIQGQANIMQKLTTLPFTQANLTLSRAELCIWELYVRLKCPNFSMLSPRCMTTWRR